MLDNLLSKYKAYRYKPAMIKAIKLAGSSKTDGLRVIRLFEKMNGVRFDPFDNSHLNLISGMGHHESFFRQANILFKKWKVA